MNGSKYPARKPPSEFPSTRRTSWAKSPMWNCPKKRMTSSSGTVSQVNEALADEPGIINDSPEEKGWLCRLTNFDSSELDDMMNEDAYQKYLRKLRK